MIINVPKSSDFLSRVSFRPPTLRDTHEINDKPLLINFKKPRIVSTPVIINQE